MFAPAARYAVRTKTGASGRLSPDLPIPRSVALQRIEERSAAATSGTSSQRGGTAECLHGLTELRTVARMTWIYGVGRSLQDVRHPSFVVEP